MNQRFNYLIKLFTVFLNKICLVIKYGKTHKIKLSILRLIVNLIKQTFLSRLLYNNLDAEKKTKINVDIFYVIESKESFSQIYLQIGFRFLRIILLIAFI